MSHRYFLDTPLPEALEPPHRAVLTGSEAHHLIRVMRAKPGDRVVLFDGSGAEFPAEIVRAGRGGVEFHLLARHEVDRELPIEVTLGVAAPKGDRQKWLVEKATELGLRRVVPLRTARSVAAPGGQTLERWRRTVIEASKQCGRNRLMEIAESQDWDVFIDGTRDVPCKLLAHPHDGGRSVAASLAVRPKRIVLAIGPEGGLTDDEVALALDAGWQPVDLGARTLRIETAAICLASLATA
jgi:16S rRNA (uracil1498-N3)-methyltransferase